MVYQKIDDTVNTLSKFVPLHLISKELYTELHIRTEKYFIKRYNLYLTSNNLEVGLKKILSEELNRSLKELNLSIIIDLSPNIYKKTLRATCNHIQQFVPWALIKCNLSHEQIDKYINNLLCPNAL